MILEDPEISWKLASILKVKKMIIRRITQKDPKYISYVLKIHKMLSEIAKLKRLVCCNLLLCSLKYETDRIFLWWENFHRGCQSEPERSLARPQSRGCLYGEQDQVSNIHSEHIVSSQGQCHAAALLSERQTLTKEVYLKILKTVIKL